MSAEEEKCKDSPLSKIALLRKEMGELKLLNDDLRKENMKNNQHFVIQTGK